MPTDFGRPWASLSDARGKAIAQLIKEHVLTMNARVSASDDPGLPMESDAVHAILVDRGMMAMREAMMKNRGMNRPGPHHQRPD